MLYSVRSFVLSNNRDMLDSFQKFTNGQSLSLGDHVAN